MNIFRVVRILTILVVIFKTISFATTGVVLNAENIFYDRKKNIVFADTDVVIKFKDYVLKTNFVKYDVEKNIIQISSNVVLEDTFGNVIYLSSLTYNINSDSIIAEDLYSFFSPYYSYSESCDLTKEKYFLKNAKLTHCDLPQPHYYLKSKSVVVYPQKKVVLYSPMMYINKIPVLYLPYYEISLKPRKDCVIIEPGYDSYKGGYAKVKYITPVTSYSELNVLVDGYTPQKVGLGVEYKYLRDNRYNGVMYGYYINEKEKEKVRWNLCLNDVHKLSSLWTLQSNLEFVSDEQMYYYYFKENWFLIKKELNSTLSIVRNAQRNNFRLSYIRKDEYDAVQQKFVNSKVELPLSFIIYPFNIWKLNIAENFLFTPTLKEGTTNYSIMVQNNITTSLTLNFFNFSIAPSVKLDTNFLDENFLGQKYYNIYNFLFPVRYRLNFWGNCEVSYSYSVKSKESSFEIMKSTSSILRHTISPRIDLYIKNIYFRSYTTYDLLKLDSGYSWHNNFLPLISDIGFMIKKLDFGLHTEYNFVTENLQNLQLSVGYIDGENRYSVIYGNNFQQPQKHFINTRIDFSSLKTWKFKVQLVNTVSEDKFDFINSTVEIYKDLHCWEAKIFYSVRKNPQLTPFEYIHEINGYVGLRFKPQLGVSLSDVERQYFPWRKY